MNNRIEDAVLRAKEEFELDFPAYITIKDDVIEIDTRISRDPSRANDGGEYNFWLEIWPHRGNVLVQEFCSCDFWQPEDEPEITELDWAGAKALVKSLAARHKVLIWNDR